MKRYNCASMVRIKLWHAFYPQFGVGNKNTGWKLALAFVEKYICKEDGKIRKGNANRCKRLGKQGKTQSNTLQTLSRTRDYFP